MSRHDEREITRRLADTPAGEPPPELLERLRADIPEDLVADLEAEEEPAARPAAPTPFSRPWLAAAATLLMLVAGGFLAWKLSQELGPVGESYVDAPPAAEQAAEPAERPEPSGAARQTGDAATPASPAADDSADAVPTQGNAPVGEERELRDEAEERATAAGASAAAPQALGDASMDAPEPVAPEPVTAAPQQPAVASRSRAEEEQPTRSLRIKVVDSSDAGLPGATVRVQGEGQTREESADVDGQVEFEGLPPGEYAVEGELEGFNPSHCRVPVAEDREVTQRKVVLSFGVAEEIVVTSDALEMSESPVAASPPPPAPPADRRVARLAPPPPPPAPRRPAAQGRPASPKLQELSDRTARTEPEPELEIVAEAVEESASEESAAVEGDVEDQALEIPKPELDRVVAGPPPPPPVNPVVETATDRLSTFGLDVDTGSFTLVRAHLAAGHLPPAAAVRVEEVVNAQPFRDPFAAAPARPGETFRVTADGAPSPFAPDRSHRLLRFRVSARELPPAERKPVVLTLVVDVSGSMEGEGLELVRAGVARLLESLRPEDRVALVVFSDDARLVAPHGEPEALAEAADALATEGGTNAESGLVLGYDTAREAFDPAAVNRVVLLSDGVANVGATGPEAILERIAAAAADGIELTTVGVGMGDFDDRMMETLADRGDGRYAYADDRREMERLFAEELDGTLQTVAEEARAQVELDPRVVESWRQVGYENRAIADHEFRYDAVDAGEIGPGHSVTALYEVKLRAEPAPGRPLALLKLRWREPAGADGEPGRFREIEERLTTEDLAPSWSAADPDLRLAAVAAELAEHLRGSPHATSAPSTLLTEARRLAAAGVEGAAELVELAEAWRRLDVPAADAEEPGVD